MARRGRPRKNGHRYKSGNCRLPQALADAEKTIVLAQPHRRGRPGSDYLCESPLGRLVDRHKLARENHWRGNGNLFRTAGMRGAAFGIGPGLEGVQLKVLFGGEPSRPDERPLYRYRMADSEYEQAKKILRRLAGAGARQETHAASREPVPMAGPRARGSADVCARTSARRAITTLICRSMAASLSLCFSSALSASRNCGSSALC
jgi:hypothetical protein